MVSTSLRRLLIGTAVVTALALVVRLAVVVELSAAPFFTHRLIDEADYHILAQRFVTGSWPSGEALFRPPLYPMFLGAIYRVVGQDVVDVKLVQVCFGALVAPMTIFIGFRVWASTRAALAAGAVVALAAPLVYYDAQLLAGSLDVALVTLAVALALHADERPSPLRWALAGLVLGAAATNRGNAILLGLPVLFWAWRRAGERRERLTSVAAFAFACALPLLPLAWHNAAYDDHPEAAYALEPRAARAAPRATVSETFARLVTGASAPLGWADGINLYLGNVPALVDVNRNDHVAHFDQYRAIVVEPWRRGKARASEHAAWFRAATWASVRSDPKAWGVLVLGKIAGALNGYEVPRGTTLYADRESSGVLRLLAWTSPLLFPSGVLLPLAAVGAVVLRRRRGARLIGGLFFVQLASVAAFFVTSRYRLPALPLAAVLVVGLVRELALVERSWRLRVAAFAGVALVVGNVRLPGAPAPTRSSAEHYFLANQLAAEGKRELAIDHYRAARAIEPRHGKAANNLGRLLQDTGKVDEAIALYREAIAIDATNAFAWSNLGTALLAIRDAAGAEAAFRAALKQSPDYIRARVNLALALVEQRRLDEALVELETAARAKPGDPEITRLFEAVKNQRGSPVSPAE